jgi:hypothetical protein
MTEAENWQIIGDLLNRAGGQVGETLDHPSTLNPDEWSNWTWETEPQGDKQSVTLKHWKDQYDFDREQLTIPFPPILTEGEQAAFVNNALEKINLLRSRATRPPAAAG